MTQTWSTWSPLWFETTTFGGCNAPSQLRSSDYSNLSFLELPASAPMSSTWCNYAKILGLWAMLVEQVPQDQQSVSLLGIRPRATRVKKSVIDTYHWKYLTSIFFKFRFSNINALIGQMIGQKLSLKSHLHAMIRTHIFNFEWINVENLTSNFLSVH